MAKSLHPEPVADGPSHTVDNAQSTKSIDEPPFDTRKPIFHVMSSSGWSSDPNGPIFWKGKYHLFFQHRPNTSQWMWGLCWDHVVSTDLAHWERLPVALAPSEGGPDADGCFSGSIQVDPKTGAPTMFYTGVRLRHNEACKNLPVPPPELDMKMNHYETQCCAVADPDDELLVKWKKVNTPWMQFPASNFTSWRDPVFIEHGDGKGKEWVLTIGSGIRGVGPTALIYRSKDLLEGWRFDGYLCTWPNNETGGCWECPSMSHLKDKPDNVNCFGSKTVIPSHPSHAGIVAGSSKHEAAAAASPNGHWSEERVAEHDAAVPVVAAGSMPEALQDSDIFTTDPNAQQQPRGAEGLPKEYNACTPPNGSKEDDVSSHMAAGDSRRWLFCLAPDACTYSVIYFLGHYSNGRFDLCNARGPFKMDLGNTLYAPFVWQDPHGRHLLWGWYKELWVVASPPCLCDKYTYSGAVTLPRCLYLHNGRLWQVPLPELALLRSDVSSVEQGFQVEEGKRHLLRGVTGAHLDIEVKLSRGSASKSGLVIGTWRSSGKGDAAIVYDWRTRLLEVVFEADENAERWQSDKGPAPVEPFDGGPNALKNVWKDDEEGYTVIRDKYDNPVAESNPTVAEWMRMKPATAGGILDQDPDAPLELRIFLDGSALEIFTGSGQALTTRVYRGQPPAGSDNANIELFSTGGTTQVERVAAYVMNPVWTNPEQSQ